MSFQNLINELWYYHHTKKLQRTLTKFLVFSTIVACAFYLGGLSARQPTFSFSCDICQTSSSHVLFLDSNALTNPEEIHKIETEKLSKIAKENLQIPALKYYSENTTTYAKYSDNEVYLNTFHGDWNEIFTIHHTIEHELLHHYQSNFCNVTNIPLRESLAEVYSGLLEHRSGFCKEFPNYCLFDGLNSSKRDGFLQCFFDECKVAGKFTPIDVKKCLEVENGNNKNYKM